jgi:cytoskeletal protein CcmA (bactofilin family)
MDPSQVQADQENDVHSLENGGDTDSGGITDATGGQSASGPPPAPKKSFIKNLWDKFNIYLMLFVLIVVVAVGLLIMTTTQSKEEDKGTKSQNLTEDDLKDLSNSDVTVGNSKQILTVQANSVFAGSVLVRSNLEIAGSLKLGGNLSLADLTVSGTAKITAADVDNLGVDNLTVGGALNLQNNLSVRGGLNVTGAVALSGGLTAASITTGSLQLNGDLNLTHHIVAGGTIPAVEKGAAVGSGGTVSLSGSDTSGSITINTGSAPPAGCFATITFSQKFASTPHVILSPVGSSAGGLDYYITRSTSGFVLCTANPAPGGQTFGFDYMILG